MNPEFAAEIDKLCDAFEQSWKAGNEPNPVEWLSGVLDEMRIPLAQQLMASLQRSWRSAKMVIGWRLETDLELLRPN